jgi:pyruvate dehydrogenase E2 component (dihydrolipoamide acetyltransferase)
MEEGTVLQWFKKEGDEVKAGERLLEVMSDKANFEVEAASNGILRKIFVSSDETVPVNAPLAVIGLPDESIDDLLGQLSSSLSGAVVSVSAQAASQIPDRLEKGANAETAGQFLISPRARRLADEKGVPISALAGIGTGPQGRIIERDVIAHIERSAALVEGTDVGETKPRATPLAARIADDLGLDLGDLALGLPGSKVTADIVRRHAGSGVPPSSSELGEPAVAQIIPLRGLRKIIADNVTRSRQTAPHVTLVSEVDMTNLVSQFSALRAEVEASHRVKISYTDILIKAAARALLDHPMANAALIDGEIRVYSDKNIGVAVAAEAGLIVPVVRNADKLSVGEISSELKALVERCRSGKQTKRDLEGGTFTITNLGPYGVDNFDPIIVSPQSCILGVGRIVERPIVLNGAIVIRSIMNLCLSFDHRVLDGAPAALFLERIRELLEAPILIFQ